MHEGKEDTGTQHRSERTFPPPEQTLLKGTPEKEFFRERGQRGCEQEVHHQVANTVHFQDNGHGVVVAFFDGLNFFLRHPPGELAVPFADQSHHGKGGHQDQHREQQERRMSIFPESCILKRSCIGEVIEKKSRYNKSAYRAGELDDLELLHQCWRSRFRFQFRDLADIPAEQHEPGHEYQVEPQENAHERRELEHRGVKSEVSHESVFAATGMPYLCTQFPGRYRCNIR